jgi:hypothetical protein
MNEDVRAARSDVGAERGGASDGVDERRAASRRVAIEREGWRGEKSDARREEKKKKKTSLPRGTARAAAKASRNGVHRASGVA